MFSSSWILVLVVALLAGLNNAELHHEDNSQPSSVLMHLPSSGSPAATALRVLRLPLGQSVNFLQFNGSINSTTLYVGAGNIPQYCSSSSVVYSVRVTDLTIQQTTKVFPSAYANFGYVIGDSLFIGCDSENLFRISTRNMSVTGYANINSNDHGDSVSRGYAQGSAFYYSTSNQYGAYLTQFNTTTMQTKLIFNALQLDSSLMSAATPGPAGDPNAYWLSIHNELLKLNYGERKIVASLKLPSASTLILVNSTLYAGTQTYSSRQTIYEINPSTMKVTRMLNLTVPSTPNGGISFLIPSTNGTGFLFGLGQALYSVALPSFTVVRSFNLSNVVSSKDYLSGGTVNGSFVYLSNAYTPLSLIQLDLRNASFSELIERGDAHGCAPVQEAAIANATRLVLPFTSSIDTMSADTSNGWLFISGKPYTWKISLSNMTTLAALNNYYVNNQAMSSFADPLKKQVYLFRGRYGTKSLQRIDEVGFCQTDSLPEGGKEGGFVNVVDQKTRTAFYPIWIESKIAKLSIDKFQLYPQVLTINTTTRYTNIQFMAIDETSRQFYVILRGDGIYGIGVDNFALKSQYAISSSFLPIGLAVQPRTSSGGTSYLYVVLANTAASRVTLSRFTLPALNYAGEITLGTFTENWDTFTRGVTILNPSTRKLFFGATGHMVQVSLESFRVELDRHWPNAYITDGVGVAVNEWNYVVMNSNNLMRFRSIDELAPL